MGSKEPVSGISLCVDDLLMRMRALDLKDIRELSQFVPVILLLPASSVHKQTPGAKSPLNQSLSEGEPTKVLRIFPKPSEQSTKQSLEGQFLLGCLNVNFVERSAHRNGEPVVLTTMEFKALQYLVQNPRRVISRAELLKQVWGYENYPRTRTVDNHVLRLRRKLERNPSRPMHIRTVHGVGYKFLP
jgi:DNA-binding response OmpR family regulator